jgi:hypothetical protein
VDEVIDDDPVVRWGRRKLLEEMSRNTRQPVLAEMAREMLAGRLTTRQAMSSDAYMEALGAAARPGMARIREMPPEAVADAEREGRAEAQRLMAEEEQRAAAGARRRHDPVDDEPTGSIMVRGTRGPAAADSDPEPVLPRSVRDRRRR